MKIKIINTSNNELPAYETAHAAGMDLRAFISEPIILNANAKAIIPTGLFMEIPIGFEAQVRPRSGLAFKHGITVLNSPGTIDADYRGEVKVLLINHGPAPFEIKNGERIAQMVITKHETAAWEVTTELSETERGHGGYGSTGK
jgi:dUTP pyrophosphatase